MTQTGSMPVLPLGYAAQESVPAEPLRRVTVILITIGAGLALLGATFTTLSMYAIQGQTAFLSSAFTLAPALLAYIPMLIAGAMVMARRASTGTLVLVLWIAVGLRLLGVVAISIVTAYSIWNSGGGSPIRSIGYLVPNLLAQITGAFASVLLPLLAIWILRRPEVRG